MIKKVALPLASLFLAYQSIKLVELFLNTAPQQFSPIFIFLLSFLLNLFITGVFAFIGFAYASSALLSDAYYKIHNPERLRAVYHFLGVKYFKHLLLAAFWGKDSNRKKYFNGTKSGIKNFDFQTRQSEIGHLAGLLAVGFASLFLLAKGHFAAFACTTIINIISNLYPIILQRMHRLQIERISKRY